MPYCISENELDTSKHRIISGPWEDCIQCESSSVTVDTSTGSNVQVDAFNQTGSNVGLGLIFSNVSGSGTTTATQGASGNPTLPENFSLNNSLGSYSITTTATFTGDVFVKFILPPSVTQIVFDSVRIFKLSSGVTTDVTVLSGQYAPDFATRTVYASVTSFSDFYVIPSTPIPSSMEFMSISNETITTINGDTLAPI